MSRRDRKRVRDLDDWFAEPEPSRPRRGRRRTRRIEEQPTLELMPSSPAQVKLLQRALARLGYRVGAVDGRYGAATERAVARLQRASGLTADGILGPQTRRALTDALKRATP